MNNKLRLRSKSVCVTNLAGRNPFGEKNPSENDEHSSDDEDSCDIENVNKYAFSSNETIELIKKIKTQIPGDDTNRYCTRIGKIIWEKIKIEGRSKEEIKSLFKSLVAKVRSYRLLGEIILDIEVYLRNSESEIVVRKPTPPLTPLMLYSNDNLNKVKEENPGLKNQQIQKILSKQFDELSVEKLNTFLKIHQELNKQYEKQLEIYFKKYPKELPKSRKLMKKTVSPAELFFVDKREEGSTLNKIELLNEWKNLPMGEKVPYIRKSFLLQQTEKDSKYITTKEVESIKEYYGRPKKFTSPYSLFISETANTIKKGMQIGERSRLLAKQWKELDPNEKVELTERFNQYKLKYDHLYADYLNRLPIDLLLLAENLTALPDTPYNLFLKDLQSKNPTANFKEEWANLSRTKLVKWILKSFEIQESAKEDNYKKLISNEEMDIIYKTLEKPTAHQTVNTFFKATISDQDTSKSKTRVESVTWSKLSKKEKEEQHIKFEDHKNVFKGQFVQYLLRLPEVCRKYEIFNSKIFTEVEKTGICLMVNRVSVDKERDEDYEEADKPTSPSKKSTKQLRKRRLTFEESVDESVSGKRNKIQPVQEKNITTSTYKKSKMNTKDDAGEETINQSEVDKSIGDKTEDKTIRSKEKTKKRKQDEIVEKEVNSNLDSNNKTQSLVEEPVEEEIIEEEIIETQIQEESNIPGRRSSRNITHAEVTPVSKKEVEEPVVPPKSANNKTQSQVVELVEEEKIETRKQEEINIPGMMSSRNITHAEVSPVSKTKVEEPTFYRSAYKFYKTNVLQGKQENSMTSWANQPAKMKEEIEKLHTDSNKKYLFKLKEYLGSLTESEIEEYARKRRELDVSSDDDDSTDDSISCDDSSDDSDSH